MIFDLLTSPIESKNKTPLKLMDENVAKATIDQFNQMGLGADAFAEKTNLANESMLSYLRTAEKGNATFAGYTTSVNVASAATKTLGITSKLAAVGMTALKAAATMGISLLVSGALKAGSELFKGLFKSKETSEEIAENFEKAKKNIESINDELGKTSKLVKESGERFAKLSKGVNSTTGKNVSLSTEEYEEFLDISNQLIETFPTITRIYDENGNAIVSLGSNVDKAVESLNKLVEAEEQLANIEIVENLPDIFKGVKDQSDKYKKEIKDKKREQKEATADSFEDQLFNNGVIDVNYSMYDDAYDVSEKIKELAIKHGLLVDSESFYDTDTDLNKYKIYLDENASRETKEAFLNEKEIQQILDENRDKLYLMEEKRKQYDNSIKATEEQNRSNWQSLNNSLASWLKTDSSYQLMNDEMQSSMMNVVNNLNFDELVDEDTTIEDLQDYVREILLKAKDENVQSVVNELFKLDFSKMPSYESRNAIMQYVNELAELLGVSQDVLLKAWGFSDKIETADNYAIVKDQIARKVIGAKQGETLNAGQQGWYDNVIKQIDDFATKYSIDTQNEIAAFNDAFAEANGDIKKAFIIYINKQKEIKADNFDSVWNSEAFEETREKLLDLAKSGELSEKTLETTKDYEELLDKTGLTAKEAKSKILDMLDATEKLAMASSGTEPLFSAYEEFLSKGFVTAATLEGLPDAFKELEGYDAFEAIVGKKSGTTEIQKAFDDIITEWYKNNEIIKGITEENKQAYIANMKDMNIANAEEVADAYLEQSELLKNAEDEYFEYIEGNGELYADYIISKGEIDSEYFEQIGKANAELFVLLGDAYKDDLENWCNLMEKKAAAQKVLENAIGGKFDDSTNLEAEAAKNGYSVAELQKKKSEYYAAQREAEEAEKTLQEDLALIKTDFDINFGKIGEDSSSVEDFNWIETLISRIERNITNLGKTISATYKTWSERNSAIKKEYAELNKELKTQIDAENYYRNKASQVKLSEDYKTKVREGKIEIESISNEETKKAIQKYQELWEAALEAEDAQEDIRASMVENFQTAFDLIQSEYDAKIGEIESRGSIIDAMIGQQEAKGHLVSKSYYEDLAKLANDNIALLTDEYNKLNNALNSSDIVEGTEMWYELKGEIYGVEEALIGARTELIEYYNEMRNLDWEIFDKQQEAISRITDETEFLIDLMSNEELFNTDTGSITEYGTATMGLHAVNYNTYLEQAQMYAKELVDINKELAEDPYDNETIERREELLGLQRDMITAAQDEMQTIKDLKSEYYNNLLNVLQELIDKRKEALQSEKDLYNYQKSIAEKTKNINSIQKQLIAYEGDNSEEAQTKIQQLKVSLEEAQQDLEETEYDKWLSDQEQMLDKLAEDAQDWVEQILKNTKEIVDGVIDATNQQGAEIKTTLEEFAKDFGYDVSDELSSVFNEEDVVSKYDEEFINNQASVLDLLRGIAINVLNMATASNTEANANGSNGGSGSGTSDNTTTKPTTNVNTSNGATKSNAADVGKTVASVAQNVASSVGSKNSSDVFISKPFKYSKANLDRKGSIVDALKYYDYDESFSARAKYYKALIGNDAYTGAAKQNSALLKKFREIKGYHEGGIIGELKNIIGNNGDNSLAINTFEKGEGIIPLSLMGDWKALIANLEPLNMSMDFLNKALIPNIKANNGTNGNVNNDVTLNVTLPNVTNYTEFRNELIKDKTFEKAFMSMNASAMLGKNSLNKFRH